MSAVASFELLLLLLAIIVMLDLIAQRLRMPRAAALVVGGICFAAIPGTPEITIDPELVFVLFLPPLLMSSAWFTSWRDFKSDLRMILQLAVGAVFFTTLAVGLVAHVVLPTLPWAACFALGAIVSPPDAVAAKAVLAKLPLPPRILMLLEGESLVNDASGLVLLRMAIAATFTGAFHYGDLVLGFGWAALGGVTIGALFAFAAVTIIRRIDDLDLGITATFLIAWISYIAGEKLGVSGVLSTVTCGMIVGSRQHEIIGAALRIRGTAVWGAAVFVLESSVFILIGLSLRSIAERLGGYDAIVGLMAPTAAVVAVVVLSRFVWVYLGSYLPRFLFKSIRLVDPYPPPAIPFVMSWAGMRGVVSLAAALALPDAFPERDTILVITFAVILVTVIVQGMTLPFLIEILLGKGILNIRREMNQAEARASVVGAQLLAVKRRSSRPRGGERFPELVEEYSARKEAADRAVLEPASTTNEPSERLQAALSAIEAGRSQLLRLHHAGKINGNVLHEIEESLDVEEISIRKLS